MDKKKVNNVLCTRLKKEYKKKTRYNLTFLDFVTPSHVSIPLVKTGNIKKNKKRPQVQDQRSDFSRPNRQ